MSNKIIVFLVLVSVSYLHAKGCGKEFRDKGTKCAISTALEILKKNCNLEKKNFRTIRCWILDENDEFKERACVEAVEKHEGSHGTYQSMTTAVAGKFMNSCASATISNYQS